LHIHVLTMSLPAISYIGYLMVFYLFHFITRLSVSRHLSVLHPLRCKSHSISFHDIPLLIVVVSFYFVLALILVTLPLQEGVHLNTKKWYGMKNPVTHVLLHWLDWTKQQDEVNKKYRIVSVVADLQDICGVWVVIFAWHGRVLVLGLFRLGMTRGAGLSIFGTLPVPPASAESTQTWALSPTFQSIGLLIKKPTCQSKCGSSPGWAANRKENAKHKIN
jgi:hypothetical protein